MKVVLRRGTATGAGVSGAGVSGVSGVFYCSKKWGGNCPPSLTPLVWPKTGGAEAPPAPTLATDPTVTRQSGGAADLKPSPVCLSVSPYPEP